MIPIIHMPIDVAIKIVAYHYAYQETAPIYIQDLIKAIRKCGYIHQGSGRFTKPV